MSAPDFPGSPRVYLDIETDLSPESLVWLVGVYHDQKDEMEYFFAEKPDEEEEMLADFLSFLEENPDATLFHYSTTRFDERILKTRLQANNLPVPDQIEESVDVGIEVETCVGMPTTSNELSAVAAEAGYDFAYPNMDGKDVASTYANCIETEKEVPKRVFQYNRDDVLAVKKIVEWMESESPSAEEIKNETGERSRYAWVADKLEKIGEEETVVLSGLRKENVNELMSVMYQRFGPEKVAVRYREVDKGEWKAVVYTR